MELVRYIHLNPLRAGLVPDLKTLDKYPYSGHSVLMARVNFDWQDTDKVLALFSEKPGAARRAYRQFVYKGIAQGKRTDLTGGGLIRSMGGWAALKALRAARVFEKGDERILGDGNFVEGVLLGSQRVGCNNDIAFPPTEFIGNSRWQRGNRRRKTRKGEEILAY